MRDKHVSNNSQTLKYELYRFSVQVEDWISQGEKIRPRTLWRDQLRQPPLTKRFKDMTPSHWQLIGADPHFPLATTAAGA
jgi:hypothetical protein